MRLPNEAPPQVLPPRPPGVRRSGRHGAQVRGPGGGCLPRSLPAWSGRSSGACSGWRCGCRRPQRRGRERRPPLPAQWRPAAPPPHPPPPATPPTRTRPRRASASGCRRESASPRALFSPVRPAGRKHPGPGRNVSGTCVRGDPGRVYDAGPAEEHRLLGTPGEQRERE
jgi:hypothetical protein